ncbi:hypothetical protein IGS60_27470, partial [Janthinobacterium sp. FW305-128]|nr:hypothetical protein [Janthinobacterium sp. FW305-128]
MENKKLTLGIGEPIDSSKMYLVRVQDNFDNAASKDGAVILTHLGDYRNSFHFAQNSIVSNHFYGKFDGECAIISPMMETFSNGQTPSGFSQADTWIAADSNKSITVPSATLVVPEGAKVPPGVDVVHYRRGATVDETIAARDKAIAEVFAAKQAPLFKVGMDSWANERHVSQSENEVAIKELFGEEIAANIATDRHSNTNDYAIEQLIASRNDLEKRMAAGEVWRLSQSGVDVPLSYTLGKVNENLGETLEKAMESAASVNAANYYAAKLAEHRAAPLAEAAPLQAASMEMPPPLPGAAVPPPLPGAVAEAAPLQAASMEMPPPLPGAAVPPPLPGAVAEAAPLQAASMEMPPPLPGAG